MTETCCMAKSNNIAPFCIPKSSTCCSDAFCNPGETCCGDSCCPMVSQRYLSSPIKPTNAVTRTRLATSRPSVLVVVQKAKSALRPQSATTTPPPTARTPSSQLSNAVPRISHSVGTFNQMVWGVMPCRVFRLRVLQWDLLLQELG